MRLCDDGHDEIVFDDGACPLCEALEDIKRKEREIERLEEAEKEWSNHTCPTEGGQQ